MDAPLRCNNITSCRVALIDQAVVTTCSHIFCLNCSMSSGLSQSCEATRQCPACRTQLPNADDVVTTVLKPTEDYKTSVLSGLDPSTIMECASRGLDFWSYQTTQEILYNEAMGRHLADKYKTLSGEMDKAINDANTEIQRLEGKVKDHQDEEAVLQGKNHELVGMVKEKHQKYLTQKTLYEAMKMRDLTEKARNRAADSAHRAINSIHKPQRPQSYAAHGPTPPAAGHASHPHPHQPKARTTMPPPAHAPGYSHLPHASNSVSHRRPMPAAESNAGPMRPPPVHPAPTRSQIPLSTVRTTPASGPRHGTSNSRSSGGYGITAGIKMGRAPQGGYHHGGGAGVVNAGGGFEGYGGQGGRGLGFY